ncbi:beta-N-acetylhexosaminidase [Polycladomyces sp. WAk]|uniref:beta-N-acetylhexosaminidase n=2 Tax=Polycladomyces zharkentensis TaxID=2807616 RepID=A0ABS2WHI7_9BACL|nr:beta-N-acetylhexosaminidase [Polycladomyces sp. WAk]
MSLDEKVGQMFMVGFQPDRWGSSAGLSAHARELIRRHHVGGVILFSRNIQNPRQVGELTNQLQQMAVAFEPHVPLLIAVDQEGGEITRVDGATEFPGNMAQGATFDPDTAYASAKTVGRELRAMGINLNLAPVLDVNNNPANPVIGVRSFGENPRMVAEMGTSAIRGYHEGEVLTAVKHFPGHGDTHVDSHVGLPSVTHDRKRLDAVELVPFREAIRGGADMVMTAHITFPAIDPAPGTPVTLSHRALTGLLREELGFQGVIITDDMEMGAIAKRFGTPQAAVRAIQAGADMVLVAHSLSAQRSAIAAVKQAVQSGKISEERIDESVRRILRLKAERLGKHAVAKQVYAHPDEAERVVGSPQAARQAEAVAARAVTLVQDPDRRLPLRPGWLPRVLVVSPEKPVALSRLLSDAGFRVETLGIDADPAAAERRRVVESAKDADAVVVGLTGAVLHPQQAELVRQLEGTGKPVIALGLNTPYDVAKLPRNTTYLALYGSNPVLLDAAVKALTGRMPLKGRLPVSIPGKYAAGAGMLIDRTAQPGR